MAKRREPPRKTIIFLTCLLSIPTLYSILYPALRTGDIRDYLPHLAVGALLGLCHLALRPILRLISAPIGCITLGLFGAVIDIGLIYLSAGFVKGFEVPSLFFAVLAALMINIICALAGGRKR